MNDINLFTFPVQKIRLYKMKCGTTTTVFFVLLLLTYSVVARDSFRKLLSRKSGLSNYRKQWMEKLKIDPELSMSTVSLVAAKFLVLVS